MPPKKNHKHDFPAYISFWLPGMGQLVKGHIAKGIITIVLNFTLLLGLPSAFILVHGSVYLPSFESPSQFILSLARHLQHVYIGLAIFWWLLSWFIFWVWNMYDAYNAN